MIEIFVHKGQVHGKNKMTDICATCIDNKMYET